MAAVLRAQAEWRQCHTSPLQRTASSSGPSLPTVVSLGDADGVNAWNLLLAAEDSAVLK